MQMRGCAISFVAVVALSLSAMAASQTAPADRIVSAIVPAQRTVTNAVNPLAVKQNDIGPVEASQMFHRMVLVLQRSPQQEAALKQLLEEQQDPKSAQYHKWLTPTEFGERFGPSDGDMAQIEGWLKSESFSVEQPPNGREYLIFTGTSAQVAAAFQTQMDNFKVNGKTYIANATAASIPTALAPDVRGVASLSSFNSEQYTPTFHQAANPKIELADGLFTGPADVDTIYDATPLQKADIEGQGESIAVIEESNINPQDVADFRTATGLPAANLNVIVNGPDPGALLDDGEEFEAALDTEWAGAVDPDATLNVIVSASTEFLQGIDYSQMYAVDYDIAPITAMGYGGCETAEDLYDDTYLYGEIYEQGAAEGISQFVSAGDSGGNACQGNGLAGYGVNGIGDSPWNVSVGGTEFIMPDPSVYFPSGSATGYIPESTWNDYQNPYDGRPLAGGGGASADWLNPDWQTGPGVPDDGARDVPDVSLLAGDNLAYMVCQADAGADCSKGYAKGAIGTSVSAQVWAGIQALVDQKNGLVGGAGNPNPTYYQLAAGSNSPFHDITTGDTKVPDLNGDMVGYTATTGYDLATGLGSVDINKLAANWMPPTGSGTVTVTLTDGAVATITHGAPVTANVMVSSGGSTIPTGDVVYMAGTQGVLQDTLDSSGADSFSFGAPEVDLPGGSYNLTAHYAGDANFAPATSNAIALTVNPEPTVTHVGASVHTAIDYGDAVSIGAWAYGTNSGTDYPVPGTYTFTDTSTSATLGTASLADTGEGFAFLNYQGAAALALGGAHALGVGSHTIVATSPTNASFQGSTAVTPATIVVDQGNVVVTLTPDHTTPALNSTVNTLVSVQNAKGYDVPVTGQVQIFNTVTYPYTLLATGTLPATPDANGTFDVTLPMTFSTAGVYDLIAYYTGDANDYGNESGAVDVTVGGLASTTTTITSLPYFAMAQNNVTIVATVAGDSSGTPPTGMVTFTNATASNGAAAMLGTAPVMPNGTATLTTNALTAGNDNIVASYSGDANYAASIAQGASIEVGDFSFSLSPTTVNVTDGQGSATITLTYSGTEYLYVGWGVQLSCSGLPTGASCNFAQSTIVPTTNANGTTSGTATFTITTTGPTLQQASLKRTKKPLGGEIPLSLAGLLALGLPFTWRKRKLFGSLMGLALLAVFVGMNGCGGGTQKYTVTSAGTPPGTTPVTVTATVNGGTGIGTLTHTTTIMLNVAVEGSGS